MMAEMRRLREVIAEACASAGLAFSQCAGCWRAMSNVTNKRWPEGGDGRLALMARSSYSC